jgi:hypothetical protein
VGSQLRNSAKELLLFLAYRIKKSIRVIRTRETVFLSVWGSPESLGIFVSSP